MILYMDTETYSSVDLKACGVGAYAAAPDAEVMLWAYAVDEGEPQVWDRTAEPDMPWDLCEALDVADEHVWHNSFFDITMVHATTDIRLPLEKTWDVMVQALAHGLPGRLDKLCEIARIDAAEAKDKRGAALIQLFCKPPGKHLKRQERATRLTHPDDWATFIEYAKSDIRSMRRLRHWLPTWNYNRNPSNHLTEHQLWQLDQKINHRGVLMDVELAQAAVAAVRDNKWALDAQVDDWTGGDVRSATQRDVILAHLLAAYGVDLPDLKAATLERRVRDESLPQAVRDLLAIRMETATASTAKYNKVLRVVSPDNRARGLIQFNGASRTGRDAGRHFQPQNLPRPNMKGEAVELGIEALKAGVAELVCAPVTAPGGRDLRLHETSVPKLAANALRGLIIAPPGRKLVVVDLSNIEGVTAAWLAGEDWKLQAYREVFADPSKPDLYRLAYGRSFGVDPMSISKAQRQLGKIQELALAYEGGVGAFVTFVLTYRMDLAAVAAAVLPVLAPEVYQRALDMLNWRRKKPLTTYGLADDVYIACEALKLLWRDAHPAISSYWKELAGAAIQAIGSPRRTVEARRLAFVQNGAWLRMLLPSGRSVCYPSACLRAKKIKSMGVSPLSHRWGWQSTYGGKIFENACQAVARDVLFASMPGVEEAGYDILLRVHDELICEAPDEPQFNAEALAQLVVANNNLHWAPDLPLAAAGFEAYRYRKDD